MSAVGIALMHVRANTQYDLNGFVFDKVIPSFTNLVFLFMMISSFAMCCGYYEKITQGTITFEKFYSKRFSKVWPYFMVLCLLDLVLSPSINSVYEVFANSTLFFGFLPDAQIEVIGVGWFLGLAFVFYLIFPFFCYLLSRKDRAWFSFVVALIFNYLCTVRFAADRKNIVYSAVFFMAGGLIYLYRERLIAVTEKYKYAVALGILIVAGIYYCTKASVIVMLVLFGLIMILALSSSKQVSFLRNPLMHFLSDISMEFYLSHMVIFRVIEKTGMTSLFKSDMLSYAVTALGTLIGTVVFAVTLKWLIQKVIQLMSGLKEACMQRKCKNG